MFKRFLATQPRTQMPLTMIGEATGTAIGDLPSLDFEPEPSSQDASAESPFVCMFEPVYRRRDNGFVPAGHKVVSQPRDDAEPDTFQAFHDHRQRSALSRAIECGISQLDIITAQIDHFLRFKEQQLNQKLVFEIDMSDLEVYREHHQHLRKLVTKTSWSGLEPGDFVIELPASHHLDPGDLYGVAHDLKELGVMIALTELDADAFSFKRIFQVAPHIIKLNGSWFEQALDDPQYLAMTQNIVAGFAAKGFHVSMTDVRTETHARFAHHCGAIRAQGPFFGSPTEMIAQGRSIVL